MNKKTNQTVTIKYDRNRLSYWRINYFISLGLLIMIFLLVFLGVDYDQIIPLAYIFGVITFLVSLSFAFIWIKLTIFNKPQLIISSKGIEFHDKVFYPWEEIEHYYILKFESPAGSEAEGMFYTKLIFKHKSGESKEISLKNLKLD